MSKKLLGWFEFGAAMLALTIVALACHAVWPDKDGMAAWVQAFGSIAAIAGSAYTVWWQVDRQTRAERNKKLEEAAERISLARRELSTVASDVSGFLLRHHENYGKQSRQRAALPLDEAEYSELLQRLTWLRARLDDEASIQRAADIRTAIVEGGFLLRAATTRQLTGTEGIRLRIFQQIAAGEAESDDLAA